jgi:hypothetical protein
MPLCVEWFGVDATDSFITALRSQSSSLRLLTLSTGVLGPVGVVILPSEGCYS